MAELASEERIAALEAENARLLAALEDVRRLVGLELPGAHATQHIVEQALAGDDSALKTALEEAYLKGAREALLEALSHEVQCGAKEYSEMVVPSASIRMLETALEDVKDVQ